MKIAIKEIPQQGAEIKLKAAVEDFDFSGEDFSLQEPVTVKVNIQEIGTKVVIRGIVQAMVKLECSRCLEDFFCHIDEPFTSTFLRSEDRLKDPDVELESEDLDANFYDGQIIDLTELVREQIILSLPMNPVCKLNCRGLCPECGKNLNEGRCSCSGLKGDIRWSKLKELKNE